MVWGGWRRRVGVDVMGGGGWFMVREGVVRLGEWVSGGGVVEEVGEGVE